MPSVLCNSEAFADDLTRVIKASQQAAVVRACLLATRDRDHAISLLKQVVPACRVPLLHFTVAGRRQYVPERLQWNMVGVDQSDAPGLLRHAQELRGGGVVILEDSTPFLRDENGDQRMRMTLMQMLSCETKSDGLVLIFLAPPEATSHLPGVLADQFVRIEVPYPRAPELEAIAREEIAAAAHRARILLDVDQIRTEATRLACGIVGLTRSGARDAVRDALAPDIRDFAAASDRLQRRKAVQLSRELAMDVLDTNNVEEPIGLDYLVEHLLINRERMRIVGDKRARGVLLVGPPGVGKTMLACAIGHLVGLTVVKFKIAALMNSMLGETESRFARAFGTLEAMSPNGVMIDEIEKAFGDSSERDGGTMMRCTGALLSWLSDNPYPNFIIATCNSLRRMGEIGLTMTRSERFDACFFVDVPNRTSRAGMLERWLAGKMRDHMDAANEIASTTEKFSGADLRSVVKHAVAKAEHRKGLLTIDLLRAEADRKRLRAIGLYDEFQELRRWGQLYCEPAGPTEC